MSTQVSAIARHVGRDPKTPRVHVPGQRQAGVRGSLTGSVGLVAAYLAARFAEDPHIWARALPGEEVPLGYAGAPDGKADEVQVRHQLDDAHAASVTLRAGHSRYAQVGSHLYRRIGGPDFRDQPGVPTRADRRR